MDERRRIVIAGGTGMIGRALTRELVAQGYSVAILSRFPERAAPFEPDTVVVPWDAATPGEWEAEVEGARSIVNLVGQPIADGRWTPKQKRRIRESRDKAGQAIVSAVGAAQRRPEVVIQASGVGYYGQRSSEILDETAQPGSDWLAQVAVQWEASSGDVRPFGVRHVVVRLGIVLSRDGGALPRLALPFRFFAGGPLGTGQQYISWVHLVDAVRAIRYLIEDTSARGVYNVTAPEAVTSRDFSRALGGVMHRPSWLAVPAPALRIALGQMADMLLTGQRSYPARLLQSGFAFRYPSLDAALAALWLER